MKKAGGIIKSIITWVIVAIAVFMMAFTIISVTFFNQTERSFFGYRAFIVLSDSMSATDFKAGDLVIVKEVDPATLREGDIISFQSTNPQSYGQVVTHKIRELTTDSTGEPGFVTYGTTTNTDDESVVTYNFVLGKYQTKIPGAGQFFQFLKTTPGYIICIFLPFFILILIQGINSIRLFKKYKQEQMDSISSERKELIEQQAKTQQMMDDLLKLKAELEQKGVRQGSEIAGGQNQHSAGGADSDEKTAAGGDGGSGE